MWSRQRIALLVPAFLGLCGGVAEGRRDRLSTAAVKAAQKAAAQGRLQEGLAALAARDLVAAAQKLSAAYLEVPSLDGLYALGQLALAEGKTVQAQDLMQRFLADPLLEAAADSLEYKEALRVLALPQLPSSKLDIQGERGTLIKIDGRPVGILPLAGPILSPPGEHTVEILAGDRQLVEKVSLSVSRFSELRYNLSTGAVIINLLPGALIAIDGPGLSKEERKRVGDAMDAAAQKERYSPLVLPAEPPPPCQAPENCLQKRARKLQAEYVVTAHADKQGAAWTFGLELFDVEIGFTAASASSSCAACTPEQGAAKLAALFAPLLKQAAERPRGKVHVVTDPSGAALLIDGQLAGVTPYEGPAFVGLHKLSVNRHRFHGEQTLLTVKENQTAEARLTLRDLPDPPPPPPCPPPIRCPACPPPPPPTLMLRLPTWRLVSGIVGITAGAVTIGFGTPAIALDGRCADDPMLPGALCLTQFQTLSAGAAITGVGGALTVAGTVLLTYSPRSARPALARSQSR